MSETRIRELVKRSQRQNDLAAMDAGVLEFGSDSLSSPWDGFFADVFRWLEWGDGTARSKYEWEEVEYDSTRNAIPVVDGLSGSIADGLHAINILETHNTVNDATDLGATWQSSVNVDMGSTNFPDGMTVQPIGGGMSATIGARVTVWMRSSRDSDDNLFYWFAVTSSIFGPCNAGGGA